MQDDEDIEEVIKGNPQVVPYLLVIKSRETLSYCVVVEKQPFMEPSTFAHAFVALMAAYYVFNISYSKGAYSPCIIIQRYIFGINDEQPIPKNVREAVTTMKNMFNDWTRLDFFFFTCVVVIISFFFLLYLPYLALFHFLYTMDMQYLLHPRVKLYTTVGGHVHHMITPLGGSI